MKKLVMLVVCALSVAFANAQSKVNWGVELGLGMSTQVGNGGGDAMFNPNVGVKLDVPLTGWVSFQTGLAWSSKGAKDKTGGVNITMNQNYLEMPLLAAFHIGTGKDFDVVLSGGAYLACGVNGKTNVSMDDLTVSWSTFKDGSVNGVDFWKGLKRFDAGIRVGAAMDFSHWQVGLNGEFGLCPVVKDGPKNLGVFASVGYMF